MQLPIPDNTKDARQPISTRTYVLMTAAHNEEAFIEKTIKSVLAQTVLPMRWLIVSDGSTDNTAQIVDSYARQHEFICFLKLTRPAGRNFGSKGIALEQGCKLLEGISFEFIGNIDADLAVEPSYFETLIDHFERDPRLGIAAGFIYEEQDGEFRSRAANRVDSVPHAAQLVRRECYEAIRGYAVFKYGGEDWYAQQCAKMKGWHAEAIPDLKVFHERHTGAANNLLRHHFRLGRLDHSFGSDPVFEFLKCALRVSEKPWFLGAVSRLLGFAWSSVIREKRPVSEEFVGFLRKEQRAKVRGVWESKMSSSIYHTEVVRTVKAAEALREAWKAMPSRIDADVDYFLKFARVYDNFVLRPHVIVLNKGAQIVAILPGRMERRSLKVRVGYKEFTLPTVNQITFVGQLLGEECEEAAAEVMKSIQTSLRRKEADVVLFHQADSEESLHRVVERAGSILTRDYFEESEENWRSRIPGEYEAFLKSRSGNTRHNIRRYSKRLLEAFPGKVQHKVFRDVGDVDVICRDCETIAAKSYHRSLGVGFFDDQATRQLLTLAAAQGWLRSYILYVDGQPSAFWNGFLYHSTFTARDTAYDAQISELRPGLYLLQRLVEDLCTNGSVHELDFGTGSAQYKRDMCDTSRLRVSKLLFAPTLKGVSVNALRTPPLALSQAGKWVLTRWGFFEKVRKVWRSRLAATPSVEGSRLVIPVIESRNNN